jgi:Flp pilus assembly protein TadG
MKKKILLFGLVLGSVAVSVYFYAYKNHRNIATEKADFSLTISNLQADFTQNDSIANAKYLDNTIEIYGKISNIDIESNGIVVDDKLFATFNSVVSKKFIIGQPIKLKGRFLGYDDLLEEFKMDQVTIVE